VPDDPAAETLHIKHLGVQDYDHIWQEMRRFTENRNSDTQDQLWLLEHPPVFTLGLAGKQEHLLDPGEIPVIHTDRGGQVTYHGPGQLVAYLLLDLKRSGMGIRRLVELLELSVIDLIQQYGIPAHPKPKAPGVYVEGGKVAALGLRVRHGSTYHGLSLNVDMDLEPFTRINPCGYPGLDVTQLKDLCIPLDLKQTGELLVQCLAARLHRITD